MTTMSVTPVDAGLSGLLDRRAIRLAERASGRFDAVEQCGRVLMEIGAVEPSYITTMLEREHDIATSIGEGVAIPHGTVAGKLAVRRDALAVLKFPEPVDWDGLPVTVCVAIAARGGAHMQILGRLAGILLDPDRAAELRAADDPDTVLRLLSPSAEAERDYAEGTLDGSSHAARSPWTVPSSRFDSSLS